MYKRIIKEKIINDFFKWKIIMILWARQIWKTTLVEDILENNFKDKEKIFFNWDDFQDIEILNKNSLEKLNPFVDSKDIIFIDEAQKIENIWNTLKILIDKYKNKKQIIITGSSSMNLIDMTNEPLTWRKIVYQMFPISISEITKTFDVKKVQKEKDSFLIYWNYPAVLREIDFNNKIKVLKELANSSLYRDILEFQQIKNSNIIMKLLKLLALQIWSEVSINELATNLWVETKTINRYIDLLEKSFIIFKLPPYFTNKRKELNKSNKIYFYDLWIRNSIINDFNILENRNDIWNLWENFLIIERMKNNNYFDKFSNTYFWRTYNQQKIDYIEESNWNLNCFEFKWWNKKIKIPKIFSAMYPKNNFTLINQENFLEFLS